MRPILAALLLAALPAAAQEAGPEIRPADRARLDGWQGEFGAAMLQALAGGAPADLSALVAAMGGLPGEVAPEGDWSCRTFKLGEIAPLIAYPPFRCRITATGIGTWRLEKLTGSQRLEGELAATEGGTLYRGVGFVAGGPATGYAGLPPDSQEAVEPGQTVAQVGWFEQVSPTRARLLLPDPILESRFDVLELTR